MSTSITKTGILIADGSGIGENLLLNSYDYSGWVGYSGAGGSGYDVVEKDGYKCIHFSGETGITKKAYPIYAQTSSTSYHPEPNEIITMSGFVKMENIVFGNTNSFVMFYQSGKTIDGKWRGADVLSKTPYTIYHAGWENFDPDVCSDWTFVYLCYQYLNYDYGYIIPNIYARDFTGDFYVRDFKIEKSSVLSPWIPNKADDLYTSSEIGFDEVSFEGNARIASGYMQAREFYED